MKSVSVQQCTIASDLRFDSCRVEEGAKALVRSIPYKSCRQNTKYSETSFAKAPKNSYLWQLSVSTAIRPQDWCCVP